MNSKVRQQSQVYPTLKDVFSDNLKFHIKDELSSIFEYLAAIVMIVILAPLMIIVSALVKITSHGPIFYKQERVGKDGEIFNVIKFRTMVVDAEAKTGAVLATKNDSRVTELGSFLRKSHIDELPQLINPR